MFELTVVDLQKGEQGRDGLKMMKRSALQLATFSLKNSYESWNEYNPPFDMKSVVWVQWST